MLSRFWWLGYVLLLAVIVFTIATKGDRWEFGRLGMPEPVFDAVGRHPDGSFVDPVNRALVESGWYQEVVLALVAFNASLLTWLAVSIFRTARENRKDREKLRRYRERMQRAINAE